MRDKLIELLNSFTTPIMLLDTKLMDWTIPTEDIREALSAHLIANGVRIPVRCKDCTKEWCYLRQELGENGFCSGAIDKNLTIGERIEQQYRRQDEIDFDYNAEDV